MEKNQPLCERCGKPICTIEKQHGAMGLEYKDACHGDCKIPKHRREGVTGVDDYICRHCKAACGSKQSLAVHEGICHGSCQSKCEMYENLPGPSMPFVGALPISEKGKEMPVPNDRCRVCYAYPHRGKAHHPECMFKPPSEWEKDFEEGGKFEHIHCSIKYDGEHECADHDCVTVALIPFIRTLLSSHASKAREEGRKEGGAYKGKHGRMMYQQGVAEGRKEGAEAVRNAIGDVIDEKVANGTMDPHAGVAVRRKAHAFCAALREEAAKK